MRPQNSRRLGLFSSYQAKDAEAKSRTPLNIEAAPADKSENFDAIKLYLKQINKYPLLSAKEEVECAKLAQNGDLQERDRMISANLRLVVKIAKRYSNCGVDLLDLIEEGNLGLLRALEKFDPEKGFRFTTYAVWWIQQNIERAVMNNAKTVRVPVHVAKLQNQIAKTVRSLSMDNYHFDINAVADKLNKKRSSIEKAIIHLQSNTSIDNPVNPNTDTCFIDYVVGKRQEEPFQRVYKDRLLENIEDLLKELPNRNFDVVARRYGLLGHREMTLCDVARELGMTKETVRKIQIQSLKILGGKNLDKFKDYDA